MHLILNSFNWKQFYAMFDVSVASSSTVFYLQIYAHALSFSHSRCLTFESAQMITKFVRALFCHCVSVSVARVVLHFGKHLFLALNMTHNVYSSC